jgi:hypothetical protein
MIGKVPSPTAPEQPLRSFVERRAFGMRSKLPRTPEAARYSKENRLLIDE